MRHTVHHPNGGNARSRRFSGWRSDCAIAPSHAGLSVGVELTMTNTSSSLISPPIDQSDIRQFGEDRVNLPADIAKSRRETVNNMRERLAGWMKDHPEYGLVKSYLSGSLAKGTALKIPSDVDVALYIKYGGERRADRKLTEWIAERIRKAFPRMSLDKIEPQEYSVKVTFKRVDIDIVPVFYEDDPDDKGWLVSQRTGRMMMTSIPMHLAFIRKRKKAHPRHFAQVVRLLKWWAAEQTARDASFRFKSFMVELICAHLADGTLAFSDYPTALQAFFNHIVDTELKSRIAFSDYYPTGTLPAALPDPIQIFDPVNPDNNVASQYTESNRRLIVAAAQDALNALNEAHTAAFKMDAVPMWQVVLGNAFKG